MFSKFARFKERARTKDFIRSARVNAARMEAEAKEMREELTKHLAKGSDPSSFNMLMLKGAVESMERNAANMRASHEKFVEFSAQPSPAYPFGIKVEN
jgi:hypothetical protein